MSEIQYGQKISLYIAYNDIPRNPKEKFTAKPVSIMPSITHPVINLAKVSRQSRIGEAVPESHSIGPSHKIKPDLLRPEGLPEVKSVSVQKVQIDSAASEIDVLA